MVRFFDMELKQTITMKIIFIATILEAMIAVLLLSILIVSFNLVKQKAKRRKIMQGSRGNVEAMAILLHIEQTGIFMNQSARVKMQMQVLPDHGRNFVAEIDEVLSMQDLKIMQQGAKLRVRYNPINHKEVMLVTTAA